MLTLICSLILMSWLHQDLLPFIEMVGEEYCIAPELIEAIIDVESSWNKDAENGSCKGLMQVSETWHKDRMERLGLDDLMDPNINIVVGTDYLHELFVKYEDVGLVLDLYNGNANAFENYENGVMSEYVTKVTEKVMEIQDERNEEEFYNMTLYDITGDMMRLLSMAEELDDPQAIEDTMEALQGELKDKADGYARVISQLEAEAEMLAQEAQRLTARRKVILNNIERMRRNLFNSMKNTGNVEFKTSLFKFKIAKNPAKLMVDDYALIPAEFFYTPPTPEKELDNKKLKEYLKGLGDAKVAYAHLQQDERLEIK